MAPESSTGTSSLQPATAALLCYLLMIFFCGLPVPGGVMLVIEKQDRFVRFHAWQSVAVGGTLWLGNFALLLMGWISGMIAEFFGEFFGLLRFGLWCGGVVVWFLVMARAYRHEAWKIPLLGDLVVKYTGEINGARPG